MLYFEPIEKVASEIVRPRHWVCAKCKKAGLAAALPKIERVFKRVIPSAPFEYSFVDDAYDAKFIAEERVGNLAAFFSALAASYEIFDQSTTSINQLALLRWNGLCVRCSPKVGLLATGGGARHFYGTTFSDQTKANAQYPPEIPRKIDCEIPIIIFTDIDEKSFSTCFIDNRFIKNMRQEDETRLWLSYREGDREAFGVIAQRYYKALLRYGMKFRVDQQVIEDSIQEVFLDLWQNRARIGNTQSIKNYLFKSLRNNVIQYYRYQQRFTQDDDAQRNLFLPDEWNIETELIEREHLNELIGQIKEQLSLLPEREREALYLRYYENLSVGEISEIMGVNKQSVSNFLQKALLKLRSKWKIALVLCMVYFRAISVFYTNP